jgi:hypothetical protein
MSETPNDIPDNVTWLQWCAGVTLSDDARERFLRCSDELAHWSGETARWAWIARWIADNACAVPGAIDLALEAWSDEQETHKGTR